VNKRRIHSSIDRLPKEIKDVVIGMLVDNQWPGDFSGSKKGTPRYEDVVSYCKFKGYAVSDSSLQRYVKHLQPAMIARAAEVTKLLKPYALLYLAEIGKKMQIARDAIMELSIKQQLDDLDVGKLKKLEDELVGLAKYFSQILSDLDKIEKRK